MLSAADVAIEDVLRYFTHKGIEVAFLVPTETGMRKSIMDATAPVRDFLRESGIHDFNSQPQGQAHKKSIPTRVVTCDGIYDTSASLYRPATKKGDPRIWINGLKSYADPSNVLALVATGDGGLLVINASRPGLVPGVASNSAGLLVVRDAACIDLDKLLAPLVRKSSEAAEELLSELRRIGGAWHPGKPGPKRDLEVGRLLEELLGISANSSKAPDYRGIEIKASRKRGGTRQTLFAKVPDWTISPLKSSAEILDAFGYQRNPKYDKQLRCTVSTRAQNTQGLYLTVEDASNRLLEASNRPGLPKVAYWPMEQLQGALREKHPETFWVSAASKKIGEHEHSRYEHVLHTQRPLTSALPTLLESGVITLDHLITRSKEGAVREQGPLFRIHRKDMDLLFPPGVLHTLCA